jgi:hypothetical protein
MSGYDTQRLVDMYDHGPPDTFATPAALSKASDASSSDEDEHARIRRRLDVLPAVPMCALADTAPKPRLQGENGALTLAEVARDGADRDTSARASAREDCVYRERYRAVVAASLALDPSDDKAHETFARNQLLEADARRSTQAPRSTAPRWPGLSTTRR